MSLGGVKAGAAYVVIGVRDQLSKELGAIRKRLMQFAAGAAGIAAAGAAAASAVATASVGAFAKTGSELNKLSKQTGHSVEELSKLKFMAEQTGVEFDDVGGAVEEFNIRMGETVRDGVGPMHDAFQALGLDANELANMPIDQAIGRIGDALNKLPKGERGFLADEIFGGDAFKIMGLLREGSDGLGEMADKAKELGLVMSNESASAGAELAATFRELQQRITGVMLAIGEKLAPVLINAMKLLGAMVSNWQETWNLIASSTMLVLTGIFENVKHTFTVAIPTILSWLGDNWTNIFRDIGMAMVTAIANAAESIRDIFLKVWEFIRSGFEGGFSDLMSEIGEIAGRNLLDGFEASTEAIPEIAQRQMTEYEKQLQKSIERSAGIIAEQAFGQDSPANKAAEDIATSVAGAAGKALTKSTQRSALGTFAVGASSAFAGTRNLDQRNVQANEKTADGIETLVEMATTSTLTFAK